MIAPAQPGQNGNPDAGGIIRTARAAHPLRDDPMMRLDAALAAEGLAPVSVAKRWIPWRWEKQLAMYWRLRDPGPYIPSPGQRDFHQSRARIKVAVAGSRYGKSMMAAREALPVVLSPATRTWIVGPTYALAEKEWAYLVSDLEALGAMEYADVARMGYPGRIEFPWGALIETKSADHPRSLLGEEVDMLIVSEASQLPRKIWSRFIRARVGSRLGRIVIPTTPFGYDSWVRDQWERGMMQVREGLVAAFEDSVEAWQFSVLENPHFSPAEYLAARDELPPEEFAEQWDGRYVLMSGRVIPQFSPKRHVVSVLPPHLEHCDIYRTIDFGLSDPNTCLWLAHDRTRVDEDVWYVVAEHYRRNELYPDFANAILRNRWSQGKRIAATIGDMADAQGRAQLTALGVRVTPELTRMHGGAKVPVDKSVRAGLSTLRTMFHQNRILVHSDCVNLIRELSEYEFDETGDKPKPGQDDHVIDPLRYLLHTLRPGITPGVERAAPDAGAIARASAKRRPGLR